MKSKNILLPITIISVGLSVAMLGSEIISSERPLRPTSIMSHSSPRKVYRVTGGKDENTGNNAEPEEPEEGQLASNLTASAGMESDITVSDTPVSNSELALEFLSAHPEAREYVENFDTYKGQVFNTNISLDLKKGEIPLFIQWDKRWGYASYGKSFLGISGCGPTCLAMVVSGLKNDLDATPYDVGKYAESKGFYVYGTGTSWSLMTYGAVHYGLSYSYGSVTAGYILGNLSSETPMICSMKPGDFTSQGHFIVLAGIDKDGKVIVNDPASPNNSAKHWDVDALIPQIKNIWKYRIQ